MNNPIKHLKLMTQKKRLAIAILAIILVVASAGAYIFMRPTKKVPTPVKVSSTETKKVDDPKLTDVRAQYKSAVDIIEHAKDHKNEDVQTAYTNAAINGAKLDESKAKEYAKHVLDQLPADLKQSTDPGLKKLFDVLTAVSNGNYNPAKAYEVPVVPPASPSQ